MHILFLPKCNLVNSLETAIVFQMPCSLTCILNSQSPSFKEYMMKGVVCTRIYEKV